MALLACPFCRELFDQREAERCPQCDIHLVPMGRLPPSLEALAEEPHEEPPEDRRFGPLYWRQGRGALLVLSLCGAALFFAPWVSLTRADAVTLRGFDLARGNLPWLWGGALGWFLLAPLVISRRTIAELQGIRVVASTFAAMTLLEVTLLALRPPAEHAYFSYGLQYAWGLYASGALSLLAVIVAWRLGASTTDSATERASTTDSATERASAEGSSTTNATERSVTSAPSNPARSTLH